jgi:hypothetical protein
MEEICFFSHFLFAYSNFVKQMQKCFILEGEGEGEGEGEYSYHVTW